MSKILMCTGKKGRVANVLKELMVFEKQGAIKILGKKLQTKRALIWSYDELKVLFEQNRPDPLPFSASIGKGLEVFVIKEQAMVVVVFSTKQVEDPLLKPKILALSRGFLNKQVQVKVTEEEFRHNDYKVERKCTGQITGPVKNVMSYKDLLEREDLCDPKTVSYLF